MSEGKKDIAESVRKTVYSNMQIMTRKTTTLRTLYVHVVLNGVIFPQILYDNVLYARHLNGVIFPQILYDNVLYARHFLLVKVFPKCYTFITYVSSYR